jgi:nucleoside phosphorylase
VAGGIRTKDIELEYGDVVVANQIAYYERGSVDKGSFRIKRGNLIKTARPLLQAAEFEIRDGKWLQLVNPKPNVKAITGLVISGEKVQKDSSSVYFSGVQHEFPDAVAVEMEGFAFYSACDAEGVPMLMVRSISDLMDDKNSDAAGGDDRRQKRASSHAAAFALQLVKNISPTSFLEEASFSDRATYLIKVESPRGKLPTIVQALEDAKVVLKSLNEVDP